MVLVEQKIQQLKELLSIPKKIVVTSHRNPDGDAIGSSLGLYHYLKKLNHTVLVTFPSAYPDFVSWMPAADKILIHDTDSEPINEALEAADIIFAMDYNGLDRIDKMGEFIGELKKTIVMIDHHLHPEEFAEYSFSDTSASSTSEMVYDFIQQMNHDHLLDKTIGECLYTGILTDTGSFKYSTSAKLFIIVSELKNKGVEDTKLQNLLFNCFPEKYLRLLGHCLNNRMELLPEYKTGIITLTKYDYQDFDIKRGDTEGIVNYLLMLKDVKLAAFITEQPTIVKLSLRSKGNFSVQEIAKKHFRGGGHKNASGGASFRGLRSTVNKFKEILPLYKEELLKD